jgi:glycerophosphoryl diester phosphodiesterase
MLMLGAIFGVLAWSARPVSDHQFFRHAGPYPLVIAHRGGAGLWPENTMHAFTRAAAMGVDVLEMDVQVTADGVLVVMHDPTLGRTTNGNGPVNGRTLMEVKRLDAAYNWSPDGGQSFPLRGRGLSVPTLQEVFAAFPEMRFNIEPKQEQPSLVRPLCRMIRDHGMTNRVLVGSFSSRILEEVRLECAEVATSASTAEVRRFMAMNAARPQEAHWPSVQALQVPVYSGGAQVLTRQFVRAAHGHNLEVHAWTVNETEEMKRLLDLGVDGIITDYPDRLMALLGRRR